MNVSPTLISCHSNSVMANHQKTKCSCTGWQLIVLHSSFTMTWNITHWWMY